jgi:DNA repair exonuclease SbcCD ATPase subunit/predicted phosphodiesterase
VVEGFKELGKLCVKHNVRGLIIAGDVFHNNKPAPNLYEIFGDCLGHIPDDVVKYIIAGNHDVTGSGRSALMPYFPEIIKVPNAVFVEGFHMYAGGTYDLNFASFRDVDDIVAMMNYDSKNKHKVLIGHFEIPGAKMGAEREIQIGSVEALPSVSRHVSCVLAGHIHKHQIFEYGDTICAYPGAISRVSHSEAKESKGFILFDANSLDMKFIKRKTDRKFVTIESQWKGSVKGITIPEATRKAGGVLRVRITAAKKYKGQIDRFKIVQELMQDFEEVKVEIIYEQAVSEETKSIAKGVSLDKYEGAWIQGNVLKSIQAKVKARIKAVKNEIEINAVSAKEHQGLYLVGIEAYNYQSLSKLKKEFGRTDCIGIFGMVEGDINQSNGTGKSSTLEVIRFGLYGNTRYSKMSSVIRDGCKEAKVTLVFMDLKGRKISITRVVKESSSSAVISIDDKDIAQGSKEVTAWVEQNFGISRKTFDAVIYYGVDRHSIIGKKSTERLKALQEPLPLDIYRKAQDKVKKERSIATKEHNAAETLYEEYKDYSNKKLEKLEQELASHNASLKRDTAKLNKVEKQIKDYEKIQAQKRELEYAVSNLESAEQTKGELKADWEKLKIPTGWISKSDLAKKRKLITSSQGKLETKLEKLRDEVASIKVKSDQLKDDIELLGSGSGCRVCGSELGEGKVQEIIQSKTKEVEQLAEKLSEVTNEGLACRKERDEGVKRLSNLETLEDNYNNYLEEEKKFKDLIKDVNADVVVCKEEVNKLKESCKGTKNVDLDELQTQRSSLGKAIRETQYLAGECKSMVDTCKSNLFKKDAAEKAVKKWTKELEICGILHEAFGSRGIPQEICMSMIDDINTVIPEIVDEMGWWQGIEISIEPDDRKSTSSIAIWVTLDGKEPREYEGLSQGEREISNLILRTAYKRVLKHLVDLNYNFVLVDEALDVLDECNLVNAINYFKNSDMQSFCISHSHLKDSFTKSLVVKNEGGLVEVL